MTPGNYEPLCRLQKHILHSFVRSLFSIAFFLIIFLNTGRIEANQNSEENVQSKDSVALDNAYFRIRFNATGCTQAHTPGFSYRIIVALSKTKIKSSRGTIKLHRGEIAVFSAEQSYQVMKGSYFEAAMKSNHPEGRRPEKWIEPRKNNIVFANDEFRVFEERLAPGDIRELHSHSQRLVVRLNKVRLTDPRFQDDPKSGSGWQMPNTVKFAEPVVHEVKNLSNDTELFNIVIEFNASK